MSLNEMETLHLDPGFAVKVSSGATSVFIRAPRNNKAYVAAFVEGFPVFDGRWQVQPTGISKIPGFLEWRGEVPEQAELFGALRVICGAMSIEILEDGDDGGMTIDLKYNGRVHQVCISAEGNIAESGSAKTNTI